MASQSLTFKLTAVVTVAALGYLVGCGTEGNNTGFTEGPIGIASTGGGPGPGPGPGPTTGINVLASGTPVVNTGFPVTVASGLTNSNMLPVADVTGASNSPTRLAMGNFAALGGLRPVVVQGNGQGPGQGRVVVMARNPGTPAGTGNLFLNPLTAVPAAPAITITDPFGLLIDGDSIYITDQFRSAGAGRVLKIFNIQASGAAQVSQIGAGNLGNPCCILKDTTGAAPNNNYLYVASYNAQGGVGKISRIDLNNTNNATNTDVLIKNVNFPSSMVMDITGGRRLLYVAENGNGSVSGAQGGVARIDLATFAVPAGGGTLTTAGLPSTGVTFVGTGTDSAFTNPYDLAIDGFGNVVISEGFSQLVDLNTVDTFPNQGRIRVIAKSTGVPPTPVNSQLVLTGLTGCRGVSTAAADSTGDAVTAFFTAGSSLTTTLRQLTFRVSDGAIYKHIQLDSGKLNPLGTLYDAGDSALSILANVKYAVTFLNSANGAVVDVR